MYIRRLSVFIKTFFKCLLLLLSVVAILFTFGAWISNYFISDYTKNNNKLFFVGFDTDSVFKIKPGFEDSFLSCISEQTTPQIQTLENIQNEQSGGAVAVNLSALSGKYGVTDGKAVINNTKFDITSLLNEQYSLPESKSDAPYILIYHTHTSEKYDGGGSVVDAGKAMAEEFENQGYKTIHITDVFDKEQFSGAYSRSIKTVEKVLKENPSIKLVFDVHRDSITDSSGTNYRPVTEVENEPCAQVMFVCGTDEKGLSHPNWRENFKFALGVSKVMGSDYNGLSRPVNLRADRFNTHLTNHTFLIEMGSEKNTVEEAKRSAVYTARSIISTIEKSE